MTHQVGDPAVGRGADLHAHTTASDGMLSPTELVRQASGLGLTALGVTDHDTVGGIREALTAGAAEKVTVVPGLELSTADDDLKAHVLGYFIDWEDATLVTRLGQLAALRATRIKRMVEKLQSVGVVISLERVLALASGGSLGRPHIARVLIEEGYVRSISEAFDRYLSAGRPGYIERAPFTPEEGIRLILAAGGVPVLAHPMSTGDPEAVVPRLIDTGLRGIEVYYGEYDETTRVRLRQLADRWSLIPTGGSDFHGPGFKPGRELGGPLVDVACVDRLRGASRANRS